MTADSGIHKIELTLPGNSTAVRSALKVVLNQLQSHGLAESECSVTELVLAEVLNNIVEHAYSVGDPGPIDLFIEHFDGRIDFSISDHGQPMPQEKLPTTSHANLSCDRQDLPEGGWGWLIIHELAEDVRYARQSEKNILEFTLSPKRAFEELPPEKV